MEEEKTPAALYDEAAGAMNEAHTESGFLAAAEAFGKIPGFRDADALAGECLDRAEECRKDAVYAAAMAQAALEEEEAYASAAGLFGEISGWKDADERAEACRERIRELREKEEARRAAEAEAEKKRRRFRKVVLPAAAAFIFLFALLTLVVIPGKRYAAATELFENGQYMEAASAFEKLKDYGDSGKMAWEAKYRYAVELYHDFRYAEAMPLFEELDGYKNSDLLLGYCVLYTTRPG